MSDFKLFLKLLKNQNGIALMMVLSAVTILTLLLVDFSFETKINKFKVYNGEDKLQARLNAEAGLSFALAKLKIYQEGMNLLEKNPSIKASVKPSMVEKLMTQPFIYPVPIGGSANIIQKNAVQKFSKNILLKGGLSVQITPYQGFLNPNNMRINPKREQSNEASNSSAKKTLHAFMEEELTKALADAIKVRREKDENFDKLYPNLNPELLIKELKYFINSPENFDDPERAEIEGMYFSKGVKPKHYPLTSISELYLLLGWPDVVIELLEDQLTVHEVSVIQVNKITDTQLRILFPEITDIQIEEFFKYRDGNPEHGDPAKDFESPEDFKKLITGTLGVLGSSEYDQRMQELQDAGLRIGVAGKLFKITSIGSHGKGKYKLTALIDLPVKPKPLPGASQSQNTNEGIIDDPLAIPTNTTENNSNNTQEQAKKNQIELMLPRVIDIITE